MRAADFPFLTFSAFALLSVGRRFLFVSRFQVLGFVLGSPKACRFLASFSRMSFRALIRALPCLELCSLRNSRNGISYCVASRQAHKASSLVNTTTTWKGKPLLPAAVPRDDVILYDETMDLRKEPLSEEFDAEYIDGIGVQIPPTFNLAAYVDRMPSLQRMVDLGVDLFVVEEDPAAAEFFVNMNFERDAAPYIRWLHDHGLPADEIGHFITWFPMIFSEKMPNLDTRIAYLRSKRFSREAIALILHRYPGYIGLSVDHVDKRLGFVQQEFNLKGYEVRHMLTSFPFLAKLHEMKLRVKFLRCTSAEAEFRI